MNSVINFYSLRMIFIINTVLFLSIEWSGAKRQSGKLGDQSVNTALACLQQCPVLGELEKWSHWSLVFKPKLGSLKRFIDKYGYMRTADITGIYIIY